MDGHLNEQQLAEVERLSSHMHEVTPNRAIVTYQWGDFKHNSLEVLFKYFDVFVHDSNFGDRRLAFRIPKNCSILAQSKHTSMAKPSASKHGGHITCSN
jgi:hypothetical protein